MDDKIQTREEKEIKLNELLDLLAKHRLLLEDSSNTITALMDNLKADPVYIEASKIKNATGEMIKSLIDGIHDISKSIFNETGEKKLLRGVEIRIGREFTVTDEKALMDWLKEKFSDAIVTTYDYDKVKDYALGKSAPEIPGTSIVETPSVRIPSKL